MVSKQTVTLANSIVGVSVLAMPFCFKQCGIILATLLLILGAVMTRMVCHFLLKAGTITRRRNYEMLAWHTFGQGGKFIVEISIIGFLIGTLIAFFVVMGDLGPQIVAEAFDMDNNYSLRNIIMAALSLFVALPLGLMKNIDSLGSVSTASVLFYVFLVFKILSEGLGPLFSGSYLNRIEYWRPQGVLQSIPILSMALSCQTQIFGIYESLPDPSLQKMNVVVKQAVCICTTFYFCVGFFGYIAFSHESFGGNILMALSPGPTTQLIKLCFLMSVVFSVPLIIFPCRASLNSLMFRSVHHHSLHDISTNYIPDGRLKFLTIIIIIFTLIVGILIPNIELVLGLVGSTVGIFICLIFPSIIFIRVTTKLTTERLLAQIIFFTGVVIMVISTYTTLYAVEQAQFKKMDEQPLPDPPRVAEIIKDVKTEGRASFQTPDSKIVEMNDNLKNKLDSLNKIKESDIKPSSPVSSTKRLEEPVENRVNVNIIEVKEKEKLQLKEELSQKTKLEKDINQIGENNNNNNKIAEEIKSPDLNTKQIQDNVEPQIVDHPIYGGVVSKDSENKIENKQSNAGEKSPALEKDAAVEILKKLEEHQENQKKLLEEQRQILAELKEHHDQDVQRQKDTEMKPLKADELINGVAKEQIKDEKIDKQVIEEKKEVLKQEKLIEKLSENLEKEKLNVKIIDKIEEGLNKEIDKIEESEPKFKLPEPIPSKTFDIHEQPVVIGENVGKMLKMVKPSSNPQIPDTQLKIVEEKKKVIIEEEAKEPQQQQKQQIQNPPIIKAVPIQNKAVAVENKKHENVKGTDDDKDPPKNPESAKSIDRDI